MNPHFRNVMSAVAGLVLVAPAVLGATAASAAPRQPAEYDALGDSFASGYGVLPVTAPCGQSQAAPAVQLDGRMKIALDDFVACAGAKTTDMGPQLAFLDDDTDLVTISIGGNDIGWGNTVGACLFYPDAVCAGAIAATRNAITNFLPSLLDSVYLQVSTDAPNAHVVVTGYPRLFSPKFGDYVGASASEQVALNDGADLLNAVIAEESDKYGFQFVDVTKRFVGHGVNAPKAWINGWDDPAGAFHPNINGYKAYTAALTSQINPNQLR